MTAKTWLILAISIILVAVSGCGDPEKSRFGAGDNAILVHHGEGKDDVVSFISSENAYVHPVVGTRVVVVADDAANDWSSRHIQINVSEGEYKGKVGTVPRWSLRPVK